jgi:hypothetical protein
VELLASYSNTLAQVGELVNRVYNVARASDAEGVSV